ncbi:MAG TPA: hypothetical protein VLI45_09325 [Acidobacteriaceae bacterium]|nr:hypothetical protein [Acidobacteriaceae bacterium]
MRACTFVLKHKMVKGKVQDVVCGLAAQDGSEYCPRHTFLHNINAQTERDKEVHRMETRRAQAAGMPKTRGELMAGGYQYTGNGECHSCEARIEWWKTPKDRPAPFDPMPEVASRAVSHFATCKHSARWRKAS